MRGVLPGANAQRNLCHAIRYLSIRDDPIFVNKSRNPQEHAAYQLYVTLLRLGRRETGCRTEKLEKNLIFW